MLSDVWQDMCRVLYGRTCAECCRAGCALSAVGQDVLSAVGQDVP